MNKLILLLCLVFLQACSARGVKYAVKEADRQKAGRAEVVTQCKQNLKDYGTALEMYYTDNAKKYPTSGEQLCPKYFKELPQCPKGTDYKYEPREDAYLITCTGDHSDQKLEAGFPRYDAIEGLQVSAPTP